MSGVASQDWWYVEELRAARSGISSDMPQKAAGIMHYNTQRKPIESLTQNEREIREWVQKRDALWANFNLPLKKTFRKIPAVLCIRVCVALYRELQVPPSPPPLCSVFSPLLPCNKHTQHKITLSCLYCSLLFIFCVCYPFLFADPSHSFCVCYPFFFAAPPCPIHEDFPGPTCKAEEQEGKEEEGKSKGTEGFLRLRY